MGTIYVKEFIGGLDSRRMPACTTGGVLITARDGHITRGGEFEKRAAFVPEYQLPPGTVGMAAVKSGLVVFGSGEAPALPENVAYQRLIHPGGWPALVRVLSAELFAGRLYVVGEYADGTRQHFYDGVHVSDWFDGRARASLNIHGWLDPDTDPAGLKMSVLQVDSTRLLATEVAWAGDVDATARAIASAVNANSGVSGYSAVSYGQTVVIVSDTAGSAYNGRTIWYAAEGLNITPVNGGAVLQAGADSGTSAFTPGTFVSTIGSKLYSVSGPNLHYSGVAQPTRWTTDVTGAGFTDMSSQAAGSEELTAIARYQDYIAVFAERVTQIWYVDPDPTLNKQTQTLNNTGTASPHSVTQFGDNDIFYLDESGVRSLRARDSSNAAATTDIGVPIDTLIITQLATMTADERAKVVGAIEPRDGRFWLAMKDIVFVFSFFSGSKVSAWSTYEPGFSIDEIDVFRRRIHVRSGNTIYVYGGYGAETVYDDVVGEARIPFLDAGTPAENKRWSGVDAAVEGAWEVYASMDPADLATEEQIATVWQTTYNGNRIPMVGSSTHISLRLKSKGSGPARIGALLIHFDGDESG